MTAPAHNPTDQNRLHDLKPRSGPAGNALRHGLTAQSVLPDRIEARCAEIRDELSAEFPGDGALRTLLISQAAYHAAALEFASMAEASALRVGAAAAPSLLLLAGPSSLVAADMAPMSAVTSHGAALVARYRRTHEHGFARCIDTLRELSQSRRAEMALPYPRKFAMEAQCESYLLVRLESRSWRCRQCGSDRGYSIASRKRRECAGCGLQHGARTGTVMQHSAVPLVTWFRAVFEIVMRTDITARELAPILSIRRAATVRSMINRIRTAIATPTSDSLLAGLPAEFLLGTNGD